MTTAEANSGYGSFRGVFKAARVRLRECAVEIRITQGHVIYDIRFNATVYVFVSLPLG